MSMVNLIGICQLPYHKYLPNFNSLTLSAPLFGWANEEIYIPPDMQSKFFDLSHWFIEAYGGREGWIRAIQTTIATANISYHNKTDFGDASRINTLIKYCSSTIATANAVKKIEISSQNTLLSLSNIDVKLRMHRMLSDVLEFNASLMQWCSIIIY